MYLPKRQLAVAAWLRRRARRTRAATAPRPAYPPLFEEAEEIRCPAGSWIGARATPEPIGPRTVPLWWPATESGRNRVGQACRPEPGNGVDARS
ncbi:hypothetical protein NDU88_003039 [Pleurodeles waltl]|uniref:Uncharacterized protein n=1 Tax=Pleurodeles waltl TaxID=8319 RepID=A0AAV7T3X2_PLEWA|nr:hypothetical protein NDU88_003039 [Pleurodeles waltl]